MIQLAVVKEQSAGGAMIWKLEPSEELCFGSEGSNKVEQLQITLPKEWDGYTVRITFLPRGRYPVGIVLPQDGIIDITADITSGAYGIGSFVLDAVQGEKVTYTVGGRYTVYTHPKAGGKAPEYTPDEYQQLVSQVKNAIPPGGTTGQVLVKKSDADRDFAWEDQSGGEQVNPDWNQNDETAPDFVRNRTHWEETAVIAPVNITWDGNTDGVLKAGWSYKVSDMVFTGEQLKKMTYTLRDGTVINFADCDWMDFTNKDIIAYADSGFAIVLTANTAVPGGDPTPLPETGVWFSSDGVSLTGPEETQSVVHKIDEKYLPNSVPSISSATVGQTVKVSAVDENGVPTKWEAVNCTSVYYVKVTSNPDGMTLKDTFSNIETHYNNGDILILKIFDEASNVTYFYHFHSYSSSRFQFGDEPNDGAHYNIHQLDNSITYS